jgi:hypothetical protein
MDVPFDEWVEVAAGGPNLYLCQTVVGTCLSHRIKEATTTSFNIPLPRKRVRLKDWKHALAQKAHLADGLPPARRPQFLAIINELPKQDQFGRFEIARADGAGRLWLRTYEHYGSPAALWLVVADGKPIARALLPGNLEPLAFAGDLMVAQLTDRDGVPSIQRYRIQ